ncbi:MAG: hypothetical protein ACT4OE_09620 [Sphingosinicella sp.]
MPERSQNIAGAVATIVFAIILIWLLFKLLGVALKLVGILLVGGLAIAAYLAVTKRIGGPGRGA